MPVRGALQVQISSRSSTSIRRSQDKSKKTYAVFPKIGLQFSSKNFQGGGFTDTVGSHETQNTPGARLRETMQLERVGGVTMGGVLFKIGGQIDDVDGLEGTLLGANTTTDTKIFTDEGDLLEGSHLDTELTWNSKGYSSSLKFESIKYLPMRLTGQLFLHSCLHFLGLHRSVLTMAIRVNRSLISDQMLKKINGGSGRCAGVILRKLVGIYYGKSNLPLEQLGFGRKVMPSAIWF